jgi:hypothetical protein
VSWANVSAQIIADQIDTEIINSIVNSTIDKKLLFHLSLSGLSFGGILDRWRIVDQSILSMVSYTDSMYELYDHRTPIVPDKYCIHAEEYRSYEGYRPEVSKYITDIIRKHYPDDYVVATDAKYYWLGERIFTHSNIVLEQERRPLSDIMSYLLIDKGQHSKGRRVVARYDVSMMSSLYNARHPQDGLEEEIFRNLIAQYKKEIRRAS